MALRSDFQVILQSFIYTNLPVLMNPSNAINVVIANQVITTNPTVAISVATTINAAPVIIFPPQIVDALQTYVLDNFPDIGLPQDIQQVAKNFFANLPPLIPIAPDVAVPVTVATTPVAVTTVSVALNI